MSRLGGGFDVIFMGLYGGSGTGWFGMRNGQLLMQDGADIVVVLQFLQHGFVFSLKSVGWIFLQLLVGRWVVQNVGGDVVEVSSVHNYCCSAFFCWGYGNGSVSTYNCFNYLLFSIFKLSFGD